MALLENFLFVGAAGLVTALATGVGVLPFFLFGDVTRRQSVALWGFSSGVMASASVFGLIGEGLAEGTPLEILIGMAVGVALVTVAHRWLVSAEIDPRQYEEANFTKLVFILGVLTVHSFPEGIAVGVSFADLGIEGGAEILGLTVPVLAIFMTIAISIHNVPEGTAIAIPLDAMGVSRPRMVWWAVFSSLPQPIGAVIAFAFVRIAREFLPYGFGFAAGAMLYLVLTEFVPEALETGRGLPRDGKPELAAGILAGIAIMVPFLLV